MKFLIAALTALFLSLFLVGISFADNNCSNTQKFNSGSVNNNCNNNSNSNSNTNTQDNNQNVDVNLSVANASTVTTLPSTGPESLVWVIGMFPVGLIVRKVVR